MAAHLLYLTLGLGVSRPSTRRLVNAGVASRRSRVWSGGSTPACGGPAQAREGRPRRSPRCAPAPVHVLREPRVASAALASSWPTTSQAAWPSASLASCTGRRAHLREQREGVVPVELTPRVERGMTAGAADVVGNLSEAGTQQVDHRQAPVDDLADRGLGADPAGLGLAQRRGGSGSGGGPRPPRPPTPAPRRCRSRRTSAWKRAATSARPCATITAAGSRARSRAVWVSIMARRGGSRRATAAANSAATGWGLHGSLLSPLGGGRSCPGGRRGAWPGRGRRPRRRRSAWTATAQERQAHQVEAGLGGDPAVVHDPALAVEHVDVEVGQVRPVASGPDDRLDAAGAQAVPKARQDPAPRSAGTAAAAPASTPARSAQASRVSSSRPSFRSASALTLGSEPENWASPSGRAANRPTSRTPSRAQRVQVERPRR